MHNSNNLTTELNTWVVFLSVPPYFQYQNEKNLLNMHNSYNLTTELNIWVFFFKCSSQFSAPIKKMLNMHNSYNLTTELNMGGFLSVPPYL